MISLSFTQNRDQPNQKRRKEQQPLLLENKVGNYPGYRKQQIKEAKKSDIYSSTNNYVDSFRVIRRGVNVPVLLNFKLDKLGDLQCHMPLFI